MSVTTQLMPLMSLSPGFSYVLVETSSLISILSLGVFGKACLFLGIATALF